MQRRICQAGQLTAPLRLALISVRGAFGQGSRRPFLYPGYTPQGRPAVLSWGIAPAGVEWTWEKVTICWKDKYGLYTPSFFYCRNDWPWVWKVFEVTGEPNCQQEHRSALLRGDEPSTVQAWFLPLTLEHNVPPWLPSFVPSQQPSRIRIRMSFDAVL